MSDSPHSEQFVALLTQAQRRLYVYILTLVGRAADADEVLQETNLVLWRKSAEFVPGTNFAAWAYRTAYFEVLAFRKKRGRESLQFDQELVAELAEVAASRAERFDERREALVHCMSRLNERDRDLVERRYLAGGTPASVAEQVGRTVQAVYQALHRIRAALLECVERTMAARERI